MTPTDTQTFFAEAKDQIKGIVTFEEAQRILFDISLGYQYPPDATQEYKDSVTGVIALFSRMLFFLEKS